MKIYRYLYAREQYHYFNIEAEDLGSAEDKAQAYIQTLDLSLVDVRTQVELEEVKEVEE